MLISKPVSFNAEYFVKQEWEIWKRYTNGFLELDAKGPNIILDAFRVNAIKQAFGGAASFTGVITSGYIYGCAGSDNTAEAATQTRLQSELIAGTDRPLITNSAGAAFGDSDIVGDISGSYTQLFVYQWKYLTSDANNGSTFAEYGINDDNTLPGTPTSTQGTMGARFVPPSSIVKSASFEIIPQVSWRN